MFCGALCVKFFSIRDRFTDDAADDPCHRTTDAADVRVERDFLSNRGATRKKILRRFGKGLQLGRHSGNSVAPREMRRRVCA
jgi:hypothetical protein